MKKTPTQRPDDIDAIPEPVHPTQGTRIANKLVYLALAVIGIILLIMLYWVLDSGPVLKVNNAPFPTRTIREHPTAGGVVILDADYCKSESIEGQLRVSFVGEQREVFLPISRERLPKGCDRREVPILIPNEIIPGEYKIKFRATYNKNPLRQNEVVEFESRTVIIDPATP